jgi:hypothetical protein
MGCERTKRERIRWLGARPSEIRTSEDRRLVTTNPHLMRDRVDIFEPMTLCGPGMNVQAECIMALCKNVAEFECDGCDHPICSAHANNRGFQTIQAESGFNSPGFRRFEYQDTYDLCPLCLFNGPPEKRSADRG